ncbi:MAG TPA: plastocyanin/azurin family copper-binding protein [Acidimicrobiia bacterium]|nr:plastocyanin/azurin family copper-binding protein [Acidimicrobiia bacterium]
MKKSLVALAVVVIASLTPAVAYASAFERVLTDDHGMTDGHGMETDEHGTEAGEDPGHENAPTKKGARRIKVTGRNFSYEPKKIVVDAGEDVTIVMKSTDIFHDLKVKGAGHVVGADAGATEKGGLRIDKPGTYKFWCTVPGHRAAGMKGKIVVE